VAYLARPKGPEPSCERKLIVGKDLGAGALPLMPVVSWALGRKRGTRNGDGSVGKNAGLGERLPQAGRGSGKKGPD
jgi:hypothetical protein